MEQRDQDGQKNGIKGCSGSSPDGWQILSEFLRGYEFIVLKDAKYFEAVF